MLVAHGASGDLEILSQLQIGTPIVSLSLLFTHQPYLAIPKNVFVLDTTSFERQLFYAGRRPPILDPTTNLARQSGPTLSLENLLLSCGIDTGKIVFHNSGNDAFSALLALQTLLEPETISTKLGRCKGLPLAQDAGDSVQAANGIPVAASPKHTRHMLEPEQQSTQNSSRIMDSPSLNRRNAPTTAEDSGNPNRRENGRGKNNRQRGRGRGRGGTQQQINNTRVEDAMRDLFV